ncbi:hypothetical protein CaCOL14_008082 [Colletotrichum acutatum]
MYREGDSKSISIRICHDLYSATNSLDTRRMIQLIRRDYQGTNLNSPSSNSQNVPDAITPLSDSNNRTKTSAPSTGSLVPRNPLKAVLQCPGLVAQNTTLSSDVLRSSARWNCRVSMFNAAFAMQ